MIKIRYADLPAGLHVRAEDRGRSTIVFLRPGLTPAERRTALVRARRNASMGHGPQLPPAGLAAAVVADHVRATLRNGATAFRAHPLLLFPPLIIVVTGMLVYLMLTAVTITIAPPPAGSSAPQPGPVPPARGLVPPGLFKDPGQAGPPASRTPRPSRRAWPGRRPRRSPQPGPDPSASGSVPPSPSPSRSGSPAPGSPGPVPSAPPSPAPTSTPSPPPCLHIGPFGICLKT